MVDICFVEIAGAQKVTTDIKGSLPVSSDALLANLETWGVDYQRYDHIPLHTVAKAKTVQHHFLTPENGGGDIKNLYLRDNKKRSYLSVT